MVSAASSAVPKRCAEPHPLGAAPRRLGSQRFFPACPGRPLPSAQQVPGYSCPPRPLQAENSQHEPTSTSVPPAKSTTAVDSTGLRRHGEIRIAHDHAPSAARATQRPHHARNVSISRNTCIDSARSDASAASLSASARIAVPAFRRAASIRAARTTADTGEPSLVKTSSALEVSSSGRNVIVSAIRTSVRQSVRRVGISAAPPCTKSGTPPSKSGTYSSCNTCKFRRCRFRFWLAHRYRRELSLPCFPLCLAGRFFRFSWRIREQYGCPTLGIPRTVCCPILVR